jgi:hypothetical protein
VLTSDEAHKKLLKEYEKSGKRSRCYFLHACVLSFLCFGLLYRCTKVQIIIIIIIIINMLIPLKQNSYYKTHLRVLLN